MHACKQLSMARSSTLGQQLLFTPQRVHKSYACLQTLNSYMYNSKNNIVLCQKMFCLLVEHRATYLYIIIRSSIIYGLSKAL